MDSPFISEPLAHSARDGASEQTYREHVGNVCRYAARFARDAAALSPMWGDSLVAAVDSAAAYHDLGKPDEIFQDVLRHNRGSNRGLKHWDAGAAHLLQCKQFEAAFLAYAHHIGLPSFPAEKAKLANGLNLVCRDESVIDGINKTVWQRSDEFLKSYLARHHTIFPPVTLSQNVHFSGLV